MIFRFNWNINFHLPAPLWPQYNAPDHCPPHHHHYYYYYHIWGFLVLVSHSVHKRFSVNDFLYERFTIHRRRRSWTDMFMIIMFCECWTVHHSHDILFMNILVAFFYEHDSLTLLAKALSFVQFLLLDTTINYSQYIVPMLFATVTRKILKYGC